jgi:hypothetical protein
MFGCVCNVQCPSRGTFTTAKKLKPRFLWVRITPNDFCPDVLFHESRDSSHRQVNDQCQCHAKITNNLHGLPPLCCRSSMVKEPIFIITP